MGVLLAIGGLVGTIVMGTLALAFVLRELDSLRRLDEALILLSGLMFGAAVWSALLALMGQRLRALRADARGLAMWGAALMIVGLPPGFLCGIALLSLLLCERGRLVLSSDYAQIRSAPATMKPRIPGWSWALLFSFLFALGVLLQMWLLDAVLF